MGTEGHSRRRVLRAAGLSGMALLVVPAVGLATGSAAHAEQDRWARCPRCEGLWFSGQSDKNTCPAGGPHGSGTSNYVVYDVADGRPGERDWRWCAKCGGLWFNGNDGYGVCPVGGGHVNNSGDYVLCGDGDQHDWRRCAKCEGLWFNGNSAFGICPAGGGHVNSSGDYALRIR